MAGMDLIASKEAAAAVSKLTPRIILGGLWPRHGDAEG